MLNLSDIKIRRSIHPVMRGSVLHPGMVIIIVAMIALLSSNLFAQPGKFSKLKVSANGHFFMTENGDPFFWLGDTGWLLFAKLDREEAVKYLDDRQKKGFNVIQVMLLHSLSLTNIYGDSALNNKNVATPKVTKGNSFSDPEQYDYWDHVDFIID